VGDYRTGSSVPGFLLDGGTDTPLSYVPGATLTQAKGINDSGEIVGTYNDASGFGHSFLLAGEPLPRSTGPAH
jgi:hypothetical protein